jgi:hypothetical protein
MHFRLALLLGIGAVLAGCQSETQKAKGTEPAKVSTPLRPQPKPGERVRQPELDGYCAETERGAAYYYHGGSPVVRVAREHGCAPLYITECEAEGRCYPPRDQEPGMWCCGDAQQEQTARATR